MFMWIMILIITLLLCGIALASLVWRFSLFSCVQKWCGERKGRRILLGLAAVFVLILLMTLLFSFTNMMIMMIILALFFAISDLVLFLICKIRKTERTGRARDIAGIVAIALTVVYFAAGWILAHHVFETTYTIRSEKIKEPLRIVLFADAHMGTTFDEAQFLKHVDLMNGVNPDVVVIAGDLVDDATDYDEMRACCSAIGGLRSTYGVFYAYGNHDKGYQGSARGYDAMALESALEEYGVRILEDSGAKIREDVMLIGRADASTGRSNGGYDFGGREEMEVLLSDIEPDVYTVVIDHQPNDYEAEAAAGANLVLSGHTHGGQLFPINRIGELIGANDKTYGHEKCGDTDFIVTSGISAWEIPFKTGCKSEFVVIDLEPER